MYLFSYDGRKEVEEKSEKKKTRDAPISFTFNRRRATVQLVEKPFSLFEKVNRGKGNDAFSLR